MTPEYRWTHEPHLRRYVIWRGGWIYQTIPISRHNPSATRTYAERSVRILNGETNGTAH